MSAHRFVMATFQRKLTPPPIRCVVPRVRGKLLAAARRAITRAHCSTGKVTRAYSPRVGKGRVISQKPPAGRKLRKGAKVSLVVSRGRRA
jgi:beta-lactam-binding protein with PASTA domain